MILCDWKKTLYVWYLVVHGGFPPLVLVDTIQTDLSQIFLTQSVPKFV